MELVSLVCLRVRCQSQLSHKPGHNWQMNSHLLKSEAKPWELVLSTETVSVENLTPSEHYLPFKFGVILTTDWHLHEKEKKDSLYSNDSSGMCMLCRAPDSSCFLEYISTTNFLLRGNWSSNRKTLHMVLWGYKEDQTMPAFTNSTLRRTVRTNLLMWFPSDISKLSCRFSTFDCGIKCNCCVYLHFAALKINLILRIWQKSFWM